MPEGREDDQDRDGKGGDDSDEVAVLRAGAGGHFGILQGFRTGPKVSA